MPKLRIETDEQYRTRTATPLEIYRLISGSTTSTGVLGFTHSMGTTPAIAIGTYYGTQGYTISATNLSSTMVDFKVFNTGSALASTGVTASIWLKI